MEDVTYLVCDDALELIAVESAQKACGYCDGCGLGTSTCRKGIWSGVVDDIDFGHFGQGGGDFHFLDDVE